VTITQIQQTITATRFINRMDTMKESPCPQW